MKIKLVSIIMLCFFLTASCQEYNQSVPLSNPPSDDFSKYWFQGKAELTSYSLKQARYGEMREGMALLIFVTEDFSYKNQVKLDEPQKFKKDAVKVLKLNLTKKFNTGVYPYSMMSSIFTPIDLNNYPNTLKTTTSSQEWCGHTYAQLNLKDENYEYLLRSYFESEGDRSEKLEGVFLEDEILTRIRINPEKLPEGEFKIIPSGLYSRLSHVPLKPYIVNAKVQTVDLDGKEVRLYNLEYLNIDRSLKIYFGQGFPFSILKWEAMYKSGFGEDAKILTTTATRKKSIILDYWNKNHLADSVYRAELGLN